MGGVGEGLSHMGDVRLKGKTVVMTRGPTKMNLLITSRCNLRCDYCVHLHTVIKDRSRPDMTVSMALEALRLFPRPGIVRLTGGEPMLHKQFGELVHAVYGAGRLVGVLTNGTKIIDRWDEVPWRKIGTLNVSMTDIDPEMYHEITGTRLLEKVIAGVDKLSSRNLVQRRVLSFTMHRGNIHQAAEFVMFAHEHRAHYAKLQQLQSQPDKDGYEGDEFWGRALTKNDREVEAAIEEQQAIVNGKLGERLAARFVGWPKLVDPTEPPRGCIIAKHMIYIDGYGDVALCCNGKGPRPEMGNIRGGAEVFSAGPMAEFRSRICDLSKPPLKKCKVCFLYYLGGDIWR